MRLSPHPFLLFLLPGLRSLHLLSLDLLGNYTLRKRALTGRWSTRLRWTPSIGTPTRPGVVFDEDAIAELADSIRAQGVLQPIVVRPGKESGRYTLILGERRLRASAFAEVKTIPAIVKRVSEQQAAEMTIVENLQRRNSTVLNEADAFATLSTQFHLTQQQIGDRVGLSRETVSNYMRLLNLGDGIVGALQTGKLTYSHARVLLSVLNPEHRWRWRRG